ncbi:hypothetical protein ACIRP7_40015 [Streptomyces sp. NPDC102270]|uniref:hypothetical protein n=1 Tax=Streptomyces sp. NPDC102270 TaxID=3366150 RepID=UPI00382214B8
MSGWVPGAGWVQGAARDVRRGVPEVALGRMAAGGRDRFSEHVEDLIRTRDALDGLMAVNRAHRETLRAG